jgi:hypothetical protein
MKRYLSRLRLERSFREEARLSAYRNLKQHKFSYHYIEMVNAYVNAYCRAKAGAITKSHQV